MIAPALIRDGRPVVGIDRTAGRDEANEGALFVAVTQKLGAKGENGLQDVSPHEAGRTIPVWGIFYRCPRGAGAQRTAEAHACAAARLLKPSVQAMDAADATARDRVAAAELPPRLAALLKELELAPMEQRVDLEAERADYAGVAPDKVCALSVGEMLRREREGTSCIG